MRRCCAPLILALVMLSCSGASGASLELHAVEETSCQACQAVDFLNAYVDSPFWIREDPMVVIPPEAVIQVRAVKVEDQIEQRVYWVAHVELDHAERVQVDEGAGYSGDDLIAITRVDMVLDVRPINRIDASIDLGRFDSKDHLKSIFPGAIVHEKTRVLRPRPEFDEFMDRMESDLEDDLEFSREMDPVINDLEKTR